MLTVLLAKVKAASDDGVELERLPRPKEYEDGEEEGEEEEEVQEALSLEQLQNGEYRIIT